MTATVDLEQLAALRVLRRHLGHVQVLDVREDVREGVEGEGATPPPG